MCRRKRLLSDQCKIPQCKIQFVTYLTPCQTCCFMCWCQKGTFDRHPGSVPSSLQLIPYGPCWNGPVGNPVISCDHAAGKGQCWTSCNNALSSREDVLWGCPGQLLSLTSLACWYFHTRQLVTVRFWPSWCPISLHDNPALFIPIICYQVAMDSFGQTITLFKLKMKSIKKREHKIAFCMCYLCGFLKAEANETTVWSVGRDMIFTL